MSDGDGHGSSATEGTVRDPATLRDALVPWLRERVEEAGLRGAIFGLSGGIDSAVVCGLAAEALGPERCLGVMLPAESAQEDARLAEAVADRFDVPTLTVDLTAPFQALLETLTRHREAAARLGRGAGESESGTSPGFVASADALARMNLKPRLRMTALYYYANLLGYLVVGTGNRAELTVGYFTKWGDGAADAFLLGDLVKAEVRALAGLLGVPEEVVARPPSAGLAPGQTDEDEMGVTYAQLDRWILEGSSGDAEADERIERRVRLSEHKRRPAPIARPE
ncbi:MAG TPA: NAD(+) synthase [Longimicrobiales bacterium]|nr:NAD(+) synthase [Longimicrobiales bacterium]